MVYHAESWPASQNAHQLTFAASRGRGKNIVENVNCVLNNAHPHTLISGSYITYVIIPILDIITAKRKYGMKSRDYHSPIHKVPFRLRWKLLKIKRRQKLEFW